MFARSKTISRALIVAGIIAASCVANIHDHRRTCGDPWAAGLFLH